MFPCRRTSLVCVCRLISTSDRFSELSAYLAGVLSGGLDDGASHKTGSDRIIWRPDPDAGAACVREPHEEESILHFPSGGVAVLQGKLGREEK